MAPPAGSDTHPTWMELDAAALRHNLTEIRRRARDGVEIIASVKANAYGHGIVPVARVLEDEGVEMLATGSFAEAKAMRDAGVSTPILMLAGTLPEGMAGLLAAGLIPTVYDDAGAQAVQSAAGSVAGGDAVVFIKVDIGLGRLGVPVSRARAFIGRVAAMQGVRVGGVYTHLSFHDAAGQAFAEDRFKLFHELLDGLKADGISVPVTQALASSASMARWTDSCTSICPGHVLYGMSPMDGIDPVEDGFKPVLSAVKSRLIHVADHSDGPPPGSGAYHARRTERRTAVVPCGANDGNRSAAPGKTAEVLFAGRRLRVLGCSLEHLTFELPEDVEIAVGDTVAVLGGDGAKRISLEEFAGWQGTSPLDVTLSFSARMPVVAV